VFEAHAANAANATLNVDALGAKTLKKRNSVSLVANDIALNQRCMVVYNADDDVYELISHVAAAGQGWEYVTALTCSGTEEDYTSIAAGYDYQFVVESAYPNVADWLVARISVAASFVSADNNYEWGIAENGTGHDSDETAGYNNLIPLTWSNVVAAVPGCAGELTFLSPGEATIRSGWVSQFSARAAGGYKQISGAGLRNAAEAIDGIRFFWQGGNSFTAGTVRIYRRSRS